MYSLARKVLYYAPDFDHLNIFHRSSPYVDVPDLFYSLMRSWNIHGLLVTPFRTLFISLLHKRFVSFPRYSPTARRDLAIISLKFSLRRKASIVMDADSFRPPVPLVYDSRTILVDLEVIQQ